MWQRACREAVDPGGLVPPCKGAVQAEAGKVKLMSKMVALSTHGSQRFAVWWDDLSSHTRGRENTLTCVLHGVSLTVTSQGTTSAPPGQQRRM